MNIPEGWSFEFNPKPIPDRSMDWDFWHSEYDGENELSGTGSSIEDCIAQIEDMEGS